MKFDKEKFILLVKRGENLSSIAKIMDMDFSNVHRQYKKLFNGITFEDLKKQLLKKENFLECINKTLNEINLNLKLIIKGLDKK